MQEHVTDAKVMVPTIVEIHQRSPNFASQNYGEVKFSSVWLENVYILGAQMAVWWRTDLLNGQQCQQDPQTAQTYCLTSC